VKKIRDDPGCFVVSLKEVKKYGLSPLDQLKKNPEAKLLFPKKAKEVKNNISIGEGDEERTNNQKQSQES